MKKSVKKAVFGAVLTAALCIIAAGPAFAGQWIQEELTWYYETDDGSRAKDCWCEIEGKQYYFDAEGKMLADTITPDGFGVNKNGEKLKALGLFRDKQSALIGEQILLTGVFNGREDELDSEIRWQIARGNIELQPVEGDSRSRMVIGKGAGEFVVAITARTKSGMNCKAERGGMILDPKTGGWIGIGNGDWKYLENGEYAKNCWKENRGQKFYLDEDGMMARNKVLETPDGMFSFDAYGVGTVVTK